MSVRIEGHPPAQWRGS